MRAPTLLVSFVLATLSQASRLNRRDFVQLPVEPAAPSGANAAGNAAGVRPIVYEPLCDVNGKITPKVFILSMVRSLQERCVIANQSSVQARR